MQRRNSNNDPNLVRPRVVVIMHSVLNLKFFWIPILQSMKNDFDVILYIRNDMPEIFAELDLPCRVVFIPIERKISPWRDLQALVAIWFQLRRDKPDLLQTITPKAGLLGMLAGRMAGVPVRIHTFQGQVWATTTGIKRKIFRFIDAVTARLSTAVLAVSQTELEFLRNEGVIRTNVGRVIGSGSISGVDLVQFDPKVPENQELRREIGLLENAFVFVYLGRLHRDKGLLVLGEAYRQTRARSASATQLLVVGPDEDNIGPILQAELGDAVIIRPYTNFPEEYLRLADVAVLPSFREGFGSSLIEAAAMGLPAIASRIYGIDCAVADGETGILFEAGSSEQLADAMLKLVNDPSEYRRLSSNAIARAQSQFDQKLVIHNLLNYYRSFVRGIGHLK